MRGKPYLLCILLFAVACEDDSTGNCVVKEIIERHRDTILGKIVFEHDGTNYTSRRTYSYDSKTNTYNETPGVTTYTWYDDGRLLREKTEGADYYQLYEYAYDDKSNVDFTIVSQRYVEWIRGNTQKDTVYQSRYIESPKDGHYRFGDVLEVYERGNLVKYGFPSPDGTFEAYGTRWTFPLVYKYDNFPNRVGNPVFRNLIFTYNWGHCPNNMIEEVYGDPVVFSKKQSFAYFGNGQLNRWEYEDTEKVFSFIYDCR